MFEEFDSVEEAQKVQEAIKLLIDADEEELEVLPPLYRQKAEEIRDRFGGDDGE